MQQILLKSKWFLCFIALYVLFIFLLPASNSTKAAYNLSNEQYHILYFLVSVPIVALWMVAYYAYRRLLTYARAIKGTPEGDDFMATANGMRWIAWGFVLPALANQILAALTERHTNGNSAFTAIVVNYMYVVVAVVAFNYFSTAARQLSQRAKVLLDVQTTKRLVGVFVLLGVIFCYVVFHELHGGALGDSQNGYYLPAWLVVTTVVMPYLYAWFVGLLAAYELLLLARKSGGILYQQAIKLLSVGLGLIIVTSSGLQYMRSIVPRSGHLSIGPTLMAAYFIYAICGVGCLLLAAGARKLAKIEEV